MVKKCTIENTRTEKYKWKDLLYILKAVQLDTAEKGIHISKDKPMQNNPNWGVYKKRQ